MWSRPHKMHMGKISVHAPATRQHEPNSYYYIVYYSFHWFDDSVSNFSHSSACIRSKSTPSKKKTTIKNKVVKTKQTNNVKRNGRSHWNACLILLCFWSNFVYSVTSLQFDGSLCVIPDVSVCVSSAMRYHRAIQSTNTRAAANSNIVVCALRFVHNFRA